MENLPADHFVKLVRELGVQSTCETCTNFVLTLLATIHTYRVP
jgi:hypothetical protein